MNNETLLPLLARLKACPAHNTFVSRELFLECWEALRREDVTPLRKPTVAIMGALLLHDHRLLNATEQEQLHALVNLALDRYEQQTNPPNKLGKLIAGIIKKE
jgi:hypothetical protein